MKTAIITGAARGIGKAATERLFEVGYNVVLVDVHESVRQTATILSDGSRVLSLIADIRQYEAVQGVVQKAVERFGRIDVVVNVAGTAHRESFEETTLDVWHMDIETNMTGTFLMCHEAVFPYMKQQGYGRLVNIASVSGKVGGIGPVHEDGSGGRSGIAYAASKAGVINMTRWIAREVGKWGITCNAVLPGPIATEMTRGHTYQMEEVPMKRWGTPEDVAEAIEFLARESNSFITGACLHVDGGLVLA